MASVMLGSLLLLYIIFVKLSSWYKCCFLKFHDKVIDRRTKRLVEELIDGKIVMSMRAIYQSKVGLILIDTGIGHSLDIVYYGLIYCHV